MASGNRIVVDAAVELGSINPMIYGHFLEHFHRCIYGGLYDEGSHLSDERGYRRDVLDALRRVRTPVLRWPGGCYADGYHWKDGVGPRDGRPTTYDLAWHVEESHRFGTDEFVEVCRLVGAEPYICVNVGTGSAEEAAEWVEYCNRRGGTRYARLREANGHAEPFGVKYWGVGNEIWGSHEIGGPLSVEEYARVYAEYAKLMKRVDPGLKVVAVGEGDPDWDLPLLKRAGRLIDYISIHAYHYRGQAPEYYQAVSSPLISDRRLSLLEHCIEVAEAALAQQPTLGLVAPKAPGGIEIAFDEWNAWGWSHPSPNAFLDEESFTKPFQVNDRNEYYTLREALFTARYLHIFHRHCRRLTMANFSPIVNVRGAIYADERGVVLRPTYHVFALYANHTGDVALRTTVESPAYDVTVPWWRGNIQFRDVPYLDASASVNREEERLYLSVINVHKDAGLSARIDLRGAEVGGEAKVWTLNGPRVDAYNDWGHTDDVKVSEATTIRVAPTFDYAFPPHSVTMMEMILTGPVSPLGERRLRNA